MKTLWTIILKILVVVSFIGVIVFVSIAVINNRNITYEGYNYVCHTRDKTDFKTLQANIETKVKVEYGAGSDPYAIYINDAVRELNIGINYLLDYLAFQEKLTKGEQDKLIGGYNNYVESFNSTQSSYNSYMAMYDEITRLSSEGKNTASEKDNLKIRGVVLVEIYAECFKLGSEFFKNLLNLIKTYTLPNGSYMNYTMQTHIIKVGLVDYSLEFVKANMESKRTGSAVANVREHENVSRFYKFRTSCTTKSETDAYTNTDFKTFTNNLNSLNIFEWAGNFEKYNKTLTEENLNKSTSARLYFNATFN